MSPLATQATITVGARVYANLPKPEALSPQWWIPPTKKFGGGLKTKKKEGKKRTYTTLNNHLEAGAGDEAGAMGATDPSLRLMSGRFVCSCCISGTLATRARDKIEQCNCERHSRHSVMSYRSTRRSLRPFLVIALHNDCEVLE